MKLKNSRISNIVGATTVGLSIVTAILLMPFLAPTQDTKSYAAFFEFERKGYKPSPKPGTLLKSKILGCEKRTKITRKIKNGTYITRYEMMCGSARVGSRADPSVGATYSCCSKGRYDKTVTCCTNMKSCTTDYNKKLNKGCFKTKTY